MKRDSRIFQQVVQAIQQANRILIVSDGKPDGDSVGSSSAVWNWLQREGKDATLFCPKEIQSVFRFIDGYAHFAQDHSILEQGFDLVLVFDASDLEHGGNDVLLAKLKKPYTLINIDHHSTNLGYGDINLVYTDACSTCEVVYDFFEANHIHIDHRMATSLLTGLCTDTSNFSNAGTNVRGMEAASALCAAGARHSDILRHLVQNKTVPALRLWGLALERLHFRPEYDLAITYFLASDIAEVPGGDEAVAGVSNFLNATCGNCDTILVLREEDGLVKGSLRSVNRDISKFAKLLGGGGHKKASGFAVPGRIEIQDERIRIMPVRA
ncbi:hypothetical protein COX00_01840 [Candidatus Uhrbacteria bacterium CG22_combo_CG10-13_8_21_14_all_47_17]|uniref:DDH domain-containing protein n=1 Tax=Candidatus Uhrbacteria bacterium CG22_combo_CG10-13_8_21_14_all_47_17 TaxID=1975041 RepID=A0A2H0BSN3_9BACT|nr:MAG: hypothetical protein COX00_01840 [Candidatus Uhrbacteria bacterium CG22_combo_CG10-13_8_21_14_all_47_17]